MDRKHSGPILEPHEENRAASVDAESLVHRGVQEASEPLTAH